MKDWFKIIAWSKALSCILVTAQHTVTNTFASQISFLSFWGYIQSEWLILVPLHWTKIVRAPKSLDICRHHHRIPVFPSVPCVTQLSPNRRNPVRMWMISHPRNKIHVVMSNSRPLKILYHAEWCFRESSSWQALRPILGLSNLTGWPILPWLNVLPLSFLYPSASQLLELPHGLLQVWLPTKGRWANLCHRACPLLMICNVSIIMN